MEKISGVINFEYTNGLGSVERLAIASDDYPKRDVKIFDASGTIDT